MNRLLTIPAIILFIHVQSLAQTLETKEPSNYEKIEDCRFLWNLHHPKRESSLTPETISQFSSIYAHYAASHPSESATFLLIKLLQQQKIHPILFALSQQKETQFSSWIHSIAKHPTLDDDDIAWIGKCIRSEEDAKTFQQFKEYPNGYSLGLYYALRNGYFFDFWASDLLQTLTNQISNSENTADVCRAIRSIPVQKFPQQKLDSLLNENNLSKWNNRMAIQMIGKIKTKSSVETLTQIAIQENQDESLIVESLIQLLKQPLFDVQPLLPLLRHSNPEIIELTIDCIAIQKQFDIDVTRMINDKASGTLTDQSKSVFWKVKNFELLKNSQDQKSIQNIWQDFINESNPYYRMLAFGALQNCKSLYPQLLDFVIHAQYPTDYYYGTSCLIAMDPERLLISGFEPLWNAHDEGIDALLYEFLRNQKISTEQQQIIQKKIHQRLSEYTLPKMVETRNEALMTLEHWGDTIQSVKNFDSGLVWTPEQLASLPNESKYLMITFHDQELDTIAFSVFKDKSPLTALHFANLVADHFYENKYFHRRVPNFVLQGGCPRGDGMGSLDFTIASEFSDSHFQKGSIGWASAGPHTESCQIFFMLDEAYTLDGRYTNMGSVTEGLEKLVHLPLGTQILRIENIN